MTTGEITVLDGPAAAVVRAALAGVGDTASVREAVAVALEVESESVDGEVFDELIARGQLRLDRRSTRSRDRLRSSSGLASSGRASPAAPGAAAAPAA